MAAVYLCEAKGCRVPPFKSKADALEHEMSKHGLTRVLKRQGEHRRITGKCKHCSGAHTSSQHASHGRGSFARTHPGRFDANLQDLLTMTRMEEMRALGAGKRKRKG